MIIKPPHCVRLTEVTMCNVFVSELYFERQMKTKQMFVDLRVSSKNQDGNKSFHFY